MLMPSIFGENLFDDFLDDFPFYYDDRDEKNADKETVRIKSTESDENRCKGNR